MSRKQNEKPMTRVPIGKKLRFEVFKRDSFTCQYCGAKAPEAVLHCDHIHPVAEGGKTELLNLVTACAACNLGKGARLLDDRSVVERQQGQLEELQARREQLEMMLEWRDAVQKVVADEIDVLSERLSKFGWEPSESGRQDLRKWVKRFGFGDTLTGIDDAFAQGLQYHGDSPTQRSWCAAFRKIPIYAGYARSARETPHRAKCAYIQGILRNRLDNQYFRCMDALEEAVTQNGHLVEDLERCAKQSSSWDEFVDLSNAAADARKQGEA